MERKRGLIFAVVMLMSGLTIVSILSILLNKRNNRGSITQDSNEDIGYGGGGPGVATTSSPSYMGSIDFAPFNRSNPPSASVSKVPQPFSLPPNTSPTTQPSEAPSVTESKRPSSSRMPSNRPSSQVPADSATSLINFYAIADVPYNETEAAALPSQLVDLPDDAEFLIHLGDIRSAKEGHRCTSPHFQDVAFMLRASRVPVFLVLGGTCF
jgi:hypothetical protein